MQVWARLLLFPGVEGLSAAIDAATEALDLQEQIGYTEGTVSALHVLGRARRLGGPAAPDVEVFS